MTEVRTYPAGVPCWIELCVSDPAPARAFYGELFGWTFAGDVARLDGRAAAGVSAGGAGRWTTMIAAADAIAVQRSVTEAGGSADRPQSCADPQGAAFSLRTSDGPPGAQIVNVAGAWNFSNLHTPMPDAARAFYGAVFGWEATDMGGGATMFRQPGYGDHLEATVDPDIRVRQANAPDGFADAIAALVPSDVPSERSPRAEWRVTFTVADRDRSAELAARLGAEVAATEETMWTRTAVIRDPQGAELTLSQFTPPAGFDD